MAKKGRPKVKLSELPKGWEKKMIELASVGGSAVELRANCFRGRNGDEYYVMSEDLWYRLIEEEPHFSLTVKRATQLCEDWWLKKGRKSLENRDFSYTGWYMNMKNRFGWTDRRDVTTKGEKVDSGVIVLPQLDE